ncbi:MAG: thiolase family protein [Chloroflexi bacterium]|nr:thiolase family protein [Chloroflexota bacterium]
MGSLGDKYAIVGVGHTKLGKVPGVSSIGFNVLAIKAALEDAGLTREDVDGVLVKYPTSGFSSLFSGKLCQALGITNKLMAVIDLAGATIGTMVQYAAMAIDAGLATTVVCSYGDNPLTGPPGTYGRVNSDDAAFGFVGAPAGYAMAARRHMKEYGTTSEQLGAIAVAFRKHASMNRNAQMQKPITLEDHQRSRWVVEPFHLLDCCLVSDGGAAVVVTSAERAKTLNKKPVYVMGWGQAHPAWDIAQRESLTVTGAKRSGEMAFKMAGVSPKDIDLAEIYDCFTYTALVTLEDYGFCKKGEGGSFVQNGRIELGGELPCNTAGGLLSESGMPGMLLLVEAVRQLRGECGPRQVNNAEIAIASSQGGILTTHATLILRR